MRTTTRVLSALCAFAFYSISQVASAASINYGNVSAPPLVFLNIVESSGTDGVPLYGTPTAFPVGLDFDPQSFVASSAGGGADITDGQLNFTLMDGPGGTSWGVRSLAVNEFGDYTVAGIGTAATGVIGAANVFVTVREVNGIPVVPFTVNASSSFSDDLSGGVEVLQPWANNVLVDLGPALTVRGYNNQAVVTKADVVLNNSLLAFSEPNTIGFIAKKEFQVIVVPEPNPNEIPEPTTLVMCGMALCGLGVARRRA